MLDKNGHVCEYDDYVLPPAPKVVTPEMIQRKKELKIEIEKFFAEIHARRKAEKESECNKNG